MAIIFLLIVMLIPSLTQARDQARTARCLANQRQLGTAHLMYASQYESFIVPAAYRDPAYPPPYTRQTEMWCTLFVNLELLPSQRNQVPGRYHRPSVSPMTAGVLCCPSGDTSILSNKLPHSLDDPQARRGFRL